MIKVAFFDLDGTITDPITHTIPASTIEALSKLQEKGIKIYVSSGRSYSMVVTIDGINQIKWDGYICNNGATVYDNEANLITATYFTSEQVNNLISKCEKENLTVTLCTPDYFLAPLGVDENMVTAHNFFGEALPKFIKPYANEHVFMAMAYAPMDYPYETFEEVDGIQAVPNRSTYADIILKNMSKAEGLKGISETLGISRDEMIAFGDESNDLEMLEYAGISVAMGNANDKVKSICSYITTNVDDDGIMNACKHFNLM
ncbi:MAG: HAD family hydrolase [Erysipelotrichales bacterium]|nr:HAD family hydrolase [Erysipelotrichales bacterium]